MLQNCFILINDYVQYLNLFREAKILYFMMKPIYKCTSQIEIPGVNESQIHVILSHFRKDDRWFDTKTESYLTIAFSIIIILGVLGNSLVCFVVLRCRYLRTPRNIFIVNLSVCDIIMCIVCMPFSLIKLTTKNWNYGLLLCRVVPSLQNIDVFVSTFTIVAIAIDRYCAIVLIARDASHRHRVKIMLAIIWITAIICCIPMLVFHHVEVPCIFEYGIFQICTEVWPTPSSRMIYSFFVTIIQYISPLIVIIGIHARICHVLSMRIKDDPITEAERSKVLRDVKRHRKNMLVLTFIAGSFAVTWLPWTVLNVSADFDYQFFLDKHFNLMYAICLLFAMSSACINPILYGWLNTNFREAFLASLLFWKTGKYESHKLLPLKTDSNKTKCYGIGRSSKDSN